MTCINLQHFVKKINVLKGEDKFFKVPEKLLSNLILFALILDINEAAVELRQKNKKEDPGVLLRV